MVKVVVQVVEGRGLSSADASGKSDPYVKLYVASTSAGNKQPPAAAVRTTKVVPQTLDPVWNESFTFEVDTTAWQQVCFAAWDKDDKGDPDDSLGTALLRLTGLPTDAAATDRWLNLAGSNATGLLHIRVQILSGKPATAAAPAPVAAPGDEGCIFHGKYAPRPGMDYIRNFAAFTVCFDGPDDDDGDGQGDVKGVPEWVAYHVQGSKGARLALPHYERPRQWATDTDLFRKGQAPDDSSYRGSGLTRGHMCRKKDADKLGEEAGSATHNVLNACPQSEEFNSGVWLVLEDACERWADRFGDIWIMSGPIFHKGSKAVEKIGDRGEFKVWVPDAFWKVVVKEEHDGSATVLAWRFDHRHDKDGKPWVSIIDENGRYIRGPPPYDLKDYLVSFKDLCAEAKLDWRFRCRLNTPSAIW